VILCRLGCAAVLVVLLTACATEKPAESNAESEAEVAQCITRETLAVTPQSADLDAATLAVMTRCHYGETLEKRLAAERPSDRESIHGLVQKRSREMADNIRVQIALARTRGMGH
jgi:hypothetical protein